MTLSKKQHITQLKNNQTRIQRLFSFDLKVQNNICDCGRYIQLNTKRNCNTSEIKKEVEQAYTCKYRYCPLCNYYRICSVSPQMFKALEYQQNKGNRILFLTLTVPNCNYSYIRQTISRMNYSFSKLVRLDFFKHVEAWVRTTEVTFNTKGEAHPHFHVCLVMNKSYFKGKDYKKYSDWCHIWAKCYKHDKTWLKIDIRKVYVSGKKAKKDLDNVSSAVKELAKYCIKSTDLQRIKTSENMEIIFNQLKGLRFIATSQNIKLSEDKKEELNPNEWELIESIILKYYPDMKQYLHYKTVSKNETV